MDEFPFTGAEWGAVNDAVLPLVNATLAEDDVLHASAQEELRCVLNQLRVRYGDHPVLLETEADFCDDDAERVALYRRAIEVAVAHGLPTLSIRLSLAQLLVDDNDRSAARDELHACAPELREADASDNQAWESLMAEVNVL